MCSRKPVYVCMPTDWPKIREGLNNKSLVMRESGVVCAVLTASVIWVNCSRSVACHNTLQMPGLNLS